MSNKWNQKNSGSFSSPNKSPWNSLQDLSWQERSALFQKSIRFAYGIGRYGLGFYGIGEGVEILIELGDVWQEAEIPAEITAKLSGIWQDKQIVDEITNKMSLAWQERLTSSTSSVSGWGIGGWGNGGWGTGEIITITIDLTRWLESAATSYTTDVNIINFMEKDC